MKKMIPALLLLALFMPISLVHGMDFCGQKGVLITFRALGYVLTVLKILVPIILIISGSIDLGKAVVGSNDDEMKRSLNLLTKRLIAGIVIFFIKDVVFIVMNAIPSYSDSEFSVCADCIDKPGSCPVPK